MPLEASWLIKPSVTAYYAASLLAGGAGAVQPLLAALAQPAHALRVACRTHEVDYHTLLDHLILHAGDYAAAGDMAALALGKAAGAAGERHANVFVPLMASVIATCCQVYPRLADELELRAGPLREQWEARGPGLMSQLARLTEPAAVVAQATMLPVYPLLGGGGRALVAYNTVVIEAVLANARFELPEVVRLGWLLAMLNFDLVRYRAPLRDPERTLPLAMIPPVLAAAAEVELARFEPASVALALSHWQPRAQQRTGTVEILMAWWQRHTEARSDWALAPVVLENMLNTIR